VSDKISTSDKNPMSDKKTVLLVSLFHPELVRGGAQQVCYELFEGLRRRPRVPAGAIGLDRRDLSGALQKRRAHHRF
jgi:hypothetical protein